METYLVESDGGPARKYYHLTEKGRSYHKELKEQWKEFVAAVNHLIEEEEQ